jgi:hypothetical protein
MKTILLFCALTLTLSLTSTLALARTSPDKVKVGRPSHEGTGCPDGSASATLSPDLRTLSVIFDRYQAEAGGPSHKKTDHLHCNLRVPLEVPPGHSLAIVKVDFRGFNSLPQGARSRFKGKFGMRSIGKILDNRDLNRDFSGPLDEDYVLSQAAQAEVWSNCGGTTELDLKTSLDVWTNKQRDHALSTVDSLDMTSDLSTVYHLAWKECPAQ